MTTPVTIVAGFLGAGKTTAIRAQLAARTGERLAIIVNDFGDASLDEVELSEGQPFQLTNIPGGCVCCTAPEGFVGALGAVLETRPDRIVIEPTGLARPQDLVDTIRRSPHSDQLELGPVVVLVDPEQVHPGGPEDLPLLRDQVEAADVLVANRTDLASPEALAHFERWSAELWPAPLVVHRTSHGRLDPSLLEWPAGTGPTSRPRTAPPDAGHGHAHSTDGFIARSWLWPADVVFARDRLLDLLARLATGRAGAPLARLKGIFRTQEGVYRLEISGAEVHDRLTSHRRDSRVDVILRSDDAGLLDAVGAELQAAVLSAEELRVDAERIELVLPDGRVLDVDRAKLGALPDGVPDVGTLFEKRSGAAARLDALWQALDLPAQGQAVVVAGDGFATEPVAVDILRQGYLVHSLEGDALPAKAGGPFRLLIPEAADAPLGACANVKGVAKIVVRG